MEVEEEVGIRKTDTDVGLGWLSPSFITNSGEVLTRKLTKILEPFRANAQTLADRSESMIVRIYKECIKSLGENHKSVC